MRTYDDIDSLPLPKEDTEKDITPEEIKFINRIFGPEAVKSGSVGDIKKILILGVAVLLLFLPIWDDFLNKFTGGNTLYNNLIRVAIFLGILIVLFYGKI